MNYIEEILREINQSKEEYVNECKDSFLREPKSIQEGIENAPTWQLESELKNHKWINQEWCKNYCKALAYELMLRNDFEEEIR